MLRLSQMPPSPTRSPAGAAIVEPPPSVSAAMQREQGKRQPPAGHEVIFLRFREPRRDEADGHDDDEVQRDDDVVIGDRTICDPRSVGRTRLRAFILDSRCLRPLFGRTKRATRVLSDCPEGLPLAAAYDASRNLACQEGSHHRARRPSGLGRKSIHRKELHMTESVFQGRSSSPRGTTRKTS